MIQVGRVPLLVLVFVVFSTALTGCVERKLSIRSEPSDARVYVDYDERGRTPSETEFTHYGSRFVRLEKAGYRTKLATINLSPPWYAYFPVNFFTEVLVPFTIVDRREHTFELTPYRVPAETRDPEERDGEREEVRKRAEELRRQLPDTGSGDTANE